METTKKEENTIESEGAEIPLKRIVIPLVLKKKWFDMILSGEKTEEYREIKDHWARRFINVVDAGSMEWQVWDEMLDDMRRPFNRHNGPDELMDFFGVRFKKVDVVHFRNGYRKDAPEMFVEFNGFKIKPGVTGWGAEMGKYYFALQLGEVLEA